MAMLETAILAGAGADKPTDNSVLTAGRLYFQTDDGGKIWRDNGTIWEDVTPGGGGGAYDIGTWMTVGGGGGAAAFENGWAADSAGALQYTKDTHGWVHIRGFANGEGQSGNTVFTLPSGMHPSQEVRVAIAGAEGPDRAIVMVGGEVAYGGSAADVGISFHISFYVGV